MSTIVSVAKAELHERIDAMTEEEAEDLLDMLLNLEDSPMMTPEEETAAREGIAEIERGEAVTEVEIRRRYGF